MRSAAHTTCVQSIAHHDRRNDSLDCRLTLAHGGSVRVGDPGLLQAPSLRIEKHEDHSSTRALPLLECTRSQRVPSSQQEV